MNFITIDFETAKRSYESACAVGMVKFIDGKKADTYTSLIRPPTLYILPEFTDIHGLTVEDVKDAPRFNEIWDNAVKPFIGDFPLAAHNAKFDMNVLKTVLKWYELPVPKFQYFCTCNIARRTWPELKTHALPALAKKFNITYKAHDALDDALTCGKLVLMSAEKFGCESITELLSTTELNMGIL